MLLLLARHWLPLDLPDPAHEPAQARETADEILSRRQYQWHDERTLLDRAGEWIADQLGRLLGPLGISGVPVWVGWLVLFALVGAVAWLIYRSRRLGGGRPGRGPRRQPRRGGDGEADLDWPAEVGGPRPRAAGATPCGRYRVLVGELAAREVITDLVGRTAGELVADVPDRPRRCRGLRRGHGRVRGVWYGGEPAASEVRDRFVARADQALRRTSPARMR